MSFLLVREIDGDSWFTWWFNHPPGPSISPKRTPMCRGGGNPKAHLRTLVKSVSGRFLATTTASIC